MKLLSHGKGSDLLDHLKEVMTGAQNFFEKVIFACHDVAKATRVWQFFIGQEKRGMSPHHHAVAGGVLAAGLILASRSDEEAQAWAVTALHVSGAHHSCLKSLDAISVRDLLIIASDSQAEAFFKDRKEGIASLLPELDAACFDQAWEFLRSSSEILCKKLNDGIAQLEPSRRLDIFLQARNCLGRLCFSDHLSAAKQSGNRNDMPHWKDCLDEYSFQQRSDRKYPASGNPLHRLRSDLKRELLNLVTQDSDFYFIDAPTGLGKTEAMLSGAESLLMKHGLQHIVFAVPQVSIADQIFDDYFLKDHAHAQIWSYRRQEQAGTERDPENECGGFSPTSDELLATERHPFSFPYNVTTFNQVLLAMFHPNRDRCIRGLGLNKAVIIMDEFHKLPMSILPVFFRFARGFAKQANCRFIFGSATPLNPLRCWDLENLPMLDRKKAEQIYQSPEIDGRRIYRSTGAWTVDELIEKIEVGHDSFNGNLLVVVNMVGKGSWPLQKYFRGSWDPWKQLEDLKSDSPERLIVCLDGLVPPALRRELVCLTKEAMKHRPVTLITTQMVEVGVDLDFDKALIDYQGIAATIQRGGRVGREGRGEPCEVTVFSLMLDDGESSFTRLLSVASKGESRLNVKPFASIQESVEFFYEKEKKFFSKWKDQVFSDYSLARELSKIQEKAFGELACDNVVEDMLTLSPQSRDLGIPMEKAQYIAELFDDDFRKEIIVLQTRKEAGEFTELCKKIASDQSSREERARYFNILADWKIALGNDVFQELPLGESLGKLPHPDEYVQLYQFESSIL